MAKKATTPGEHPLVSIVVPCYNAGTTIERCISSILAQEYRNLEVIAVNDSSTDSTGSILDLMAGTDKRLRVLHSPENGGPHKTRQLGIQIARGALIGFVDSDDHIRVDMIHALVLSMLRHQADIGIGGFVREDENGMQHIKQFTTHERLVNDDILGRFSRYEFGSGMLWNKMFSADLIREHTAFPLERNMDFGEDYIVSVGCFSAAKSVVLLPQAGYHYLYHAVSGSHSVDRAGAFSRILIGYAKCLEVYSKGSKELLEAIDRIYRHQLRFDGYHVAQPADLEPQSKLLASALTRIAHVRPESVHTLVHTFDPSLDPAIPRKVRFHLGQVRRSLKLAMQALLNGQA